MISWRRFRPRHKKRLELSREANRDGESRWRRGFPAAVAALCLVGGGISVTETSGEEAGEAVASRFEEQSLALRTALHYDPFIEAPLRSLIKLYGEAGRLEELLSVYQSHLQQYPQDASAEAVLIRLFRESNHPEAGPATRLAVKRFPEDDLIRYLYYRELDASRDPEAIVQLSEAIILATLPNRKRAWLDELLTRAALEGNTEMARKHLVALVSETGDSAEGLLDLGRKMHALGLYDLAIETVERARAIGGSPESMVEMELLAAKAEAAAGKGEEAGARLDALLDRVASDYWRRSQIVVERVHLLGSDAARGEVLRESRRRFEENPGSEAAAHDLAEVLVASELRKDALEVLLAASRLLPYSEAIESRTLEILDRLGDERSARSFLEERLEAFPERLDLRYRLVKALYLTGLSSEAGEAFEGIVAQLGEEEALQQRLELARFLRRMNQPADAIALFEKVTEIRPGRLDVLRELGEAYLAVGRRESARRLFVEAIPKEAEIENFLDSIQFLLRQGMLVEAVALLEERLEVEDGNFDVRLLAIEVYGKTGEQLKGESLLMTTRELVDTGVRFRRWLETGAEFHDAFNSAGDFFDAERLRLTESEGEWTAARVAKFLAYCEVATERQQHETAVTVMRERVLDETTPADLRIRLRRLLMASLERDPLNAVEVQDHLAVLLREDVARVEEYRLRQARFHRMENRPDLALPLLADLDVAAIDDVVLLSGAIDLFLELNLLPQVRSGLERLTVLDPDSFSHWEKYLGVLGSFGDEAELRRAIRSLLAGADRIDLGDESMDALRLHLMDSYWRSIAGLLAGERAGGEAEVFNTLNEIEREGGRQQDRMWVLWTRAYLLNRLGEDRARDEVIDRLAGVAGGRDGGEDPGRGSSPGNVAEARLDFPDGLSVSMNHALAILREPPGAARAEAIEEGRGPRGESLELAWVFESDPATAIVQVEDAGRGGVVILDDQGNLYRVAMATGKLLWKKKREEVFASLYQPTSPVTREASRQLSSGAHGGVRPGYPTNPARGSLEPSQLRLAPRVAIASGHRLLAPAGRELRCFDAESGELLWVSEAGGPTRPFHAAEAGSIPPGLSVFPAGDRVFTFEPRSGIACGFALETGKLIWRSEVYTGDFPAGEELLFGLNAGASYADGRLLVYGHRAAILDCENGERIWTFEGKDVRTFPLNLALRTEGKVVSEAALSPLRVSMSGASRSFPAPPPTWINHLATSGERDRQIPNFLKYRGALVAPALHWVQAQAHQMQPSRGELHGSQMLLMGPSGVRQFPLDLPLGARSHSMTGTFAGFAGGKACILRGAELSFLDLASGRVDRLRIEGLPERAEVEVALAGPRIYLSSVAGVHCINAHNGRSIFQAPWPEEMTGFPASEERAAESGEAEYYWSGVAGSGNGKPGYCIAPRNRVIGETLLAIVGPGAVAAVRAAD